MPASWTGTKQAAQIGPFDDALVSQAKEGEASEAPVSPRFEAQAAWQLWLNLESRRAESCHACRQASVVEAAGRTEPQGSLIAYRCGSCCNSPLVCPLANLRLALPLPTAMGKGAEGASSGRRAGLRTATRQALRPAFGAGASRPDETGVPARGRWAA